MARINMSSPWVIYYREVQAMFQHDREVHVIFDEDAVTLKIYVECASKAEALGQLFPPSMEFGNVTMDISIIPANVTNGNRVRGKRKYVSVPLDIFEAAFDGNPIFCFTEEIDLGMSNRLRYVVFRKEVVQYFNDDLGSFFGMCSTLYENIARDIFVTAEGVFYCTCPEDPDDNEVGVF